MHTHTPLIRSLGRVGSAASTAFGLACAANLAIAAAPSNAPQVLLAITNSESMDGTTAGAIMVGSGMLGSNYSSLSSSSSPINYTVPSGFTPPVTGAAPTSGAASGVSPYTAVCSSASSTQCDNGPSRMNFTKAAISSVLATYANTLNFGVYTYSTGSPTLYTTWVYYMSPAGGDFTFTNTSSASTVANPCYNYSSASSTVNSNCQGIESYYGTNSISGKKYMTIGISSDDPQINDVLYAGGGWFADLLTYEGASPANPYTYYSLSTYNTNIGGYSERYSNTQPNIGGWSTTPTNAGYVPFTQQVFYSQRGFGYGASQSATTGTVSVAMNTDPASSTFTAALAPETNDPSTGEIKSVAGQSAIYALMNGARSYLGSLSTTTCQGQYVVLLTDGLPTLDSAGQAWPPLGTTTANQYGLSATFGPDGSFTSSTSQAVTDAITSIQALYNAAGSTHIKVYVIGLGAGVDRTVNPQAYNVLQAMAIAGGTSAFFPANSAAQLNTAFANIVNNIYNDSAIAAPVAPISVANGSGYEYNLTSVAVPAAGHVQAFAVTAGGAASTTVAWDAAQPPYMTVASRQSGTAALIAPKAAGTMDTILNLATSSTEKTVFAIPSTATSTSCIPDAATVAYITINPSYASGPCSGTGANAGTGYLAGRLQNWLLGAFSTQNSGHYVPPPSSTLLALQYPSYVTYATATTQRSRTPMLMFTDADGFLYAIDASGSSSSTAGNMLWGWTTRNVLPNLQNYSTFAGSGSTDGGFTVVDAMDGSSVWGSYLVGSFQSGAEHFSVKLDSSGKPNTMVYDTVVTGGTSAGDKAGASGATPLRQPTIVAYIGNSAYAVYVVTVGTTSTLYEVNVATHASTSTALTFTAAHATATSALAFNVTTNELYIGASDGTVWVTTLTSGTAATDIMRIMKIGTTVDPANASTTKPVLYVGYAEVGGIPYVYALNSSQLTVFGVTGTGFTPLWAATSSQGYTYSSSSTSYSASSTVTALTANSVVTDIPLIIGTTTLLVPVYVPGTGCTNGTGYYDFFDLRTGAFPTTVPLTLNGNAVTSDVNLGTASGPAYTPTVTNTSSGLMLNSGSKATVDDSNKRFAEGTAATNRPFSWRQH